MSMIIDGLSPWPRSTDPVTSAGGGGVNAFDITELPRNMREKVMVAFSGRETNGSVCWEWTGCVNSKGYGCTAGGRKGVSVLAHRKAYEVIVGEIPSGMTIDHLCTNKICVNTDHMEVVSRSENSKRARRAQTHCKRGHPLSGDNVWLTVRKATGHTHRVCKSCHRIYGKNKAVAPE